MRGTRAYVRIRLPPPTCATLAISCCMRSQPRSGTSPQAPACSRSVLSITWLETIGAATVHCVFHAPPSATLSGTQVCIRVDSCHSSSTSASGREVGHLHTYPKPHTWKQFTSLINISDISLVRCFVPKLDEFVSERIFFHRQCVVADRLLEPQVLDLDVRCSPSSFFL